eukprot:COSAG02_NODE_2392_length_8974_cov_2.135437_10_plen_163_part_00
MLYDHESNLLRYSITDTFTKVHMHRSGKRQKKTGGRARQQDGRDADRVSISRRRGIRRDLLACVNLPKAQLAMRSLIRGWLPCIERRCSCAAEQPANGDSRWTSTRLDHGRSAIRPPHQLFWRPPAPICLLIRRDARYVVSRSTRNQIIRHTGAVSFGAFCA